MVRPAGSALKTSIAVVQEPVTPFLGRFRVDLEPLRGLFDCPTAVDNAIDHVAAMPWGQPRAFDCWVLT